MISDLHVLSEAFDQAINGRRVLNAVFTTFEYDPVFFEQEILPNLFDANLSHIPAVRSAQLQLSLIKLHGQIVVFYDSAGLVPGAESPKLDVRNVPVRYRKGLFHPKNVFLLVEQDTDEGPKRSLLVASLSANLTRSGWWSNVECCQIEEVPEGDRTSLREPLLRYLSFLNGQAQTEEAKRGVREISAHLKKTEQRNTRTQDGRLFTQFFDSEAHDSLPDFLERAAPQLLRGCNLEIISPFFDQGETSEPLAELIHRFGLEEVRICLPENRQGEIALTEAFYENVDGMKNVFWAQLPGAVTNAGDDNVRFVHAKVYRFFKGTSEYVFVGSANCTRAAHTGANYETGFLVEVPGSRRRDFLLERRKGGLPSFAEKVDGEPAASDSATALQVRYRWDTHVAAELPTHQARLQGLFAEYRKEKTELRDTNRDGVTVEASESTEEAGGADTFFAWFFRGVGPRKVFSGATLKKRFVSSSGAFATFFEENVVAVLLQVAPGEVPRKLVELVGEPQEAVMAGIAEKARTLLRAGEKVTRAARFEAVQAATVFKLKAREDALGTLANHLWHELYEGLGGRSIPRSENIPVEEYLTEETFFTELRRRPELQAQLMPGSLPTTREQFNLHWFKVALLGSLARLGHALIDLYVTVVRHRPSLGLGRREEDQDDGGEAPVARFLDLLAAQAALPASTRTFCAFDELHLAAQNFDAIFDTNLTHLRERKLSEVRRAVGSTLGEQQPVGGMHGSVNKSLISQFRMPGYPIVLVTTDLLQEGEDLHTFCSDVFHYGISWTPSAMEQRIGRIDRVRSQTDRRLSSLTVRPSGEEKLQVFVPTLRESVEVLQVNRVLRRMNRFVELMHEGVGQMRGDDPKIDVNQESLESIEPPPALPDVELKSSFHIDPKWLRGKRTALAVSEKEAAELVRRFHALRGVTMAGEHRVEWEPIPADRNDRLFGTVWLDQRQQPFALSLRIVKGQQVLKCVSPVGRVLDQNHVGDVAAGPWTRIGVTYAGTEGSYDLSVDDEVLLKAAEQDVERLRLLLLRVTRRADELELRLLSADEPLEKFRNDLNEGGRDET